MTNAGLPAVPHAEYVSLKLESQGGVGRLKWSLAGGELPPGIEVVPSGFLTGVPGKPGTFDFTIQVTDNHPQEQQSATKALSLTVGEPADSTILVRKYDKPVVPVLDGDFDEPYWNFSQARQIEKPVKGDPTADVLWDIFWMKDLNNKKNVDLYIGAKVDVGEMGKTAGDALHFFFDGNNNDEIIYNYDDSHFRIKRNGDNGGNRLVAGYTSFFSLQLAVRERDYGYDIEARFSSGALTGRGIVAAWPEFYASGFDIAVDQGSDESEAGSDHRKVWQGDEMNDTETDAYGAIVFAGEPSEPLAVRRLVNGDFADDQMLNPNWIEPGQMPKHTWLTTTQRAYYPAWHIQPGVGAIQGDPKERTVDHRGDEIKPGYMLAQIIDAPPAGKYKLSFESKTPNNGLKVGAWGADFQDRFKADSLTLPEDARGQPNAAQYLAPQEVPQTGDDTWRETSHEFDLPENEDGEFVLVFMANEQGNLGSGIRNVELTLIEK